MAKNSRSHWWTSIGLLLVGGAMAVVLRWPEEPLASIPRPTKDQSVLRVGYAQNLLPDPHRRLFPLPQYHQLMDSLWEPLIGCDPATNQPRPAAAESWTWSPDRLTLTLQLRRNARWSNGDPVTAQDFVRGWLRLLRLETSGSEILFPLKNAEAYSQGKLKNAGVIGLQAVDAHTLKLSLDQPRSTLVVELADPVLSPLHATSEKVLANKSYFATPTELVTNGPFRLVKANADGFSLVANHYYHGSAGVRLAGVEFIRADKPSLAPLMVAAGVVDLFSPTPFGKSRRVATDRRVRMESELGLAVDSIDFNVTRGPLHDVRVRQALALALRRDEPIQTYDPDRMLPAWSWVPSMPGRPGLALLKEDANEARRLLAAAGYPEGRGFPVLRIALPVWMKSDPYPEAWSEQWFRELGIRSYIAYEARVQWVARVQAGDYDVICSSLTATVPDAGDLMSGFLWPGSNPTRWRDDEVMALLREANTEAGDERLATLEKAERKIMAAVPSVPVMFQYRQSLLAAEVAGWYLDPLGRQSPRRLWLDKLPERNPAAIPAYD